LRFGFDERTKAHSYVKFARLTLMKLTADVCEKITQKGRGEWKSQEMEKR